MVMTYIYEVFVILIFVMEDYHRGAMLRVFPDLGAAGKINVLGIQFMSPALVDLLKEKVENCFSG
jgi:predicted protein tyrosine phosphatase